MSSYSHQWGLVLHTLWGCRNTGGLSHLSSGLQQQPDTPQMPLGAGLVEWGDVVHRHHVGRGSALQQLSELQNPAVRCCLVQGGPVCPETCSQTRRQHLWTHSLLKYLLKLLSYRFNFFAVLKLVYFASREALQKRCSHRLWWEQAQCEGGWWLKLKNINFRIKSKLIWEEPPLTPSCMFSPWHVSFLWVLQVPLTL